MENYTGLNKIAFLSLKLGYESPFFIKYWILGLFKKPIYYISSVYDYARYPFSSFALSAQWRNAVQKSNVSVVCLEIDSSKGMYNMIQIQCESNGILLPVYFKVNLVLLLICRIICIWCDLCSFLFGHWYQDQKPKMYKNCITPTDLQFCQSFFAVYLI